MVRSKGGNGPTLAQNLSLNVALKLTLPLPLNLTLIPDEGQNTWLAVKVMVRPQAPKH